VISIVRLPSGFAVMNLDSIQPGPRSAGDASLTGCAWMCARKSAADRVSGQLSVGVADLAGSGRRIFPYSQRYEPGRVALLQDFVIAAARIQSQSHGLRVKIVADDVKRREPPPD
jgi:hypothetical protein